MISVAGRRRLIVMRHAKAEPFASTDHARALTERGRSDAVRAGECLARLGLVPDHAVVSSANRTRETWAAVADASGSDAGASYDDAVYHGGVDTVLESLHVVPDDRETVILVGHNPAAAYLGHLLDDGEGDPDAISGMLRGFPASALVAFDVDVPWAALGADTGRVTAFHAPGQ